MVHQVRVLVVTMFDTDPEDGNGEAFRWRVRDGLDTSVALPGLCADFPVVHGRADGLWLLTTGMGESNAAASVAALALSGQFDLSRAYVLIAGIAGIDPAVGTIGSVVCADYAVHGGYAHELDAREIPASWPHGFVPLGASAPGKPPELRVPGEVYRLDESLRRAAATIGAGVPLADDPAAAQMRAAYPGPGGQAPAVLSGSSLTTSVFWFGQKLGERASGWVHDYTDRRGRYAVTQMEDNATLVALDRAAQAGLVDFSRVAVLRSGANFDRAAPGHAPESAFTEDVGWTLAAENVWRVGSRLAGEIMANWEAWEQGVPAHLAGA
ncbi:purine-nucleoside phosphorylase [Catenulispora pinisilvae]|uniref:purine-nucleoside phosphorylase n=1 Tax=Catenulispora pinisilvae TaxID=2705253 RepID=UPI001891257E|nr:purine nucleoside permease [Catenulispora pinisilvae]